MYVTIAYYEGFRNQYTAAEQHRENKPSAQINTPLYKSTLTNIWGANLSCLITFISLP